MEWLEVHISQDSAKYKEAHPHLLGGILNREERVAGGGARLINTISWE